MQPGNGSVLGKKNATFQTGASGVFKLNEQQVGMLSSTWPGSSTPVVFYALLVAGGGGGGVTSAGQGGSGGAGAGGMFEPTGQIKQNVPLTVTIGAGGPGGNTSTLITRGSNTTITSSDGTVNLIAYGGGHGLGFWANMDSDGSGGSGGGLYTGTTGAVFGQGNIGGNSGGPTNYGGGGGGGAGAAGGNADPGTGGAGRAALINGTTYAGGGGGGGRNQAGTGGAGGGGNGTTGSGTGQSGSANTGGGGGSGAEGGTSGSGGSGIAIIAYPDSYPVANTTGSPSYSVSSGRRVYTFTGNGTLTIPT